MAKRKNSKKGKQRQLSLPATVDETPRPRILVLEALSGAAAAVRAAGGIADTVRPSAIATLDRLDEGGFDGLLLTGGSDVDPRRYGQRPHPEVYGVNETRDAVEFYALKVARRLGVPVLGICRGHQIQNVEAGGTLRQHIEGHRGGRHVVYAETGGLLANAAGMDEMAAISLHHQAVGKLGRGYVVAARSKSGTVEAIATRDGRCLGVQFHPEMDARADYAKGIFRWLVVEAAKRAGLPAPPVPVVKETRFSSGSGWVSGLSAETRREVGLDADDVDPRSFVSVAETGGRTTRDALANAYPGETPEQQAARMGWPEPRRGRQAGTATVPRRRSPSAVAVTWLCPTCGIRFDEQDDRDDHLLAMGHGSSTVRAAAAERRGIEL